MKRLLAPALLTATFATACSSSTDELEPQDLSSFGAYGLASTVDGFSFYPPFVPSPTIVQGNDGRAAAHLVIYLERTSSGTAYDTTVASFRSTGASAFVLKHDTYFLNLRAADFFTSSAFAYRLRVAVPSGDLGTVDVPAQIFDVIARIPDLRVGIKLHVEARSFDGDRDGIFDWDDDCPTGPICTCTDGVQNRDETGVDCGGAHCTSCETCTDAIQNQGEEGIDCGGPCTACTCPAGATPNLYYLDVDGDGFGNRNIRRLGCTQPAGWALATNPCSNGSATDCNVSGSTLIATSAFVPAEPLEGWVQCAGFINTSGDDVRADFLDNCRDATALRIRVFTAAGALEEDIYDTALNSRTTWPNWNYLGSSSPTIARRTNWGSTTFFTTTDGLDACRQASAPSGATLGTGNGSVAIVAGGNTNASEYRLSCGGASLVDRRVAIYRQGVVATERVDCNDSDARVNPSAAESCNGHDDDCDGIVDDGNPGSNAACSTGLHGTCGTGATTCLGGQIVCNQTVNPVTESCNGLDDDCDGATDESGIIYYRDADGDGVGNPSDVVDACTAPAGYVASIAPCSNGSNASCNVTGTTLISASSYIDPTPPAGWVQCAGFINTSGDDVAHNFFDNCLGSRQLRVRVRNAAGVIEEDLYDTNLNSYTAWPNWNYLGSSSPTVVTRTSWGSTTFFTTTDGRDACNQSSASSGNTLGTGNGSVSIIAGGNTGANEYRLSCGGASLQDRRVAIFRQGAAPTMQDCNDQVGTTFPGATESCNLTDDDCDGVTDEGNPGGGVACTSGQPGICSPGTTVCTSAGLVCQPNSAPTVELCNGIDDDCDGVVDDACLGATCSNGSGSDCNVAGTTLITSSAWVDQNPPTGWTQCAGFTNTSGNDVAHNFFNNCLGTSRLRVRIYTTAGVLEEDVSATGMTVYTSSWPNWNYLGGTTSNVLRTRWGSTTFFTTTDGRDACAQYSGGSGNTLGTGNGSVGLIAGGNSGADEYRVSCGGASLVDRRIAIYR
ncbi:putative metal-binding motif-containing protein [Myxococcota bacterium]|nr:putative metal-binding motif-containing protein [Myxococcota bacterium]